MEKMECYENYPLKIVTLTNLQTLGIYAIGAYVLSLYSIWAAALYLLYALWNEVLLLKDGCVNCFYYRRMCGFGRGRISALFFRKGKPEKFTEKQFTWKDILPSFMTFLIPLFAGIILLVQGFDWILLTLLIILSILGTVGNAVTRGQYACKHCRQLELGCPAAEMFQKK